MGTLRDVLKRSSLTVGAFALYGGLVILIAIFAAQETRHAFLPPSMTRRLWASTLVTIGGAESPRRVGGGAPVIAVFELPRGAQPAELTIHIHRGLKRDLKFVFQ